jgi:hypothetical protein
VRPATKQRKNKHESDRDHSKGKIALAHRWARYNAAPMPARVLICVLCRKTIGDRPLCPNLHFKVAGPCCERSSLSR